MKMKHKYGDLIGVNNFRVVQQTKQRQQKLLAASAYLNIYRLYVNDGSICTVARLRRPSIALTPQFQYHDPRCNHYRHQYGLQWLNSSLQNTATMRINCLPSCSLPTYRVALNEIILSSFPTACHLFTITYSCLFREYLPITP